MANPNAAALAALNQRIPHTCPVCGKTFTGLKIARYCSNRCRQANKYAKTKAGKKQ